MRLLIQRVIQATIGLENEKTHTIRQGVVVYVGISNDDNLETIETASQRILHIGLFEDDHGKLKQSITDIDGSILLVPNFTLYGKNKKGNQIDFSDAGDFTHAEKIFTDLTKRLKKDCPSTIQTGKFGTYMQIKQTVDGPVSVLLDL